MFAELNINNAEMENYCLHNSMIVCDCRLTSTKCGCRSLSFECWNDKNDEEEEEENPPCESLVTHICLCELLVAFIATDKHFPSRFNAEKGKQRDGKNNNFILFEGVFGRHFSLF